jgi:hypothetical protein
VEHAAVEKKKHPKKTGTQWRKRRAKEIESESMDNTSDIDGDYVLPTEILDCIEVL